MSYCSPAHQKEDWKAHKVQCPRLAQEALATVLHPCDEELLLRITTCLAQNRYHKEVGVMVQLNKAFWTDEQIWDAYKDYTPGPDRRTRLIYVSSRGYLNRVKWFLARGAKTTTGTVREGCTPLIAASQSGHLDIVRLLLDRGTDVNATREDNGFTALTEACQTGQLEIVHELLGRGANVHAARKTDGSTPLIVSSLLGHLRAVRGMCSGCQF